MRKVRFKNEKDFCDAIEYHIDQFDDVFKWGGLKGVHREFQLDTPLGKFRFDFLLTHKDDTVTIIEAKMPENNNNTHFKGIGQLISYGSMLKRLTHYGKMPRLILASPKIKEVLPLVLKDCVQPIDLLTIKGDRWVVYQHSQLIESYISENA